MNLLTSNLSSPNWFLGTFFIVCFFLLSALIVSFFKFIFFYFYNKLFKKQVVKPKRTARPIKRKTRSIEIETDDLDKIYFKKSS